MRITRVGSSGPRLGSISRREKVERIAGAPKRAARRRASLRRADVVGDVSLERLAGQPERAVARRNGVGGVIANDQDAAVERALDSFDRLEGLLRLGDFAYQLRVHRAPLLDRCGENMDGPTV